MDDKKGFDSVEAIIILVGVLLVGSCVAMSIIMGVVSTFTHKGIGIF
jgi:hypothetical protein